MSVSACVVSLAPGAFDLLIFASVASYSSRLTQENSAAPADQQSVCLGFY